MADLTHAATLRKAGAALENQNYAQARRLCRQILKRHRGDGEALMMLAQAAWGERCFDEAISTLQRFVKLHPNNPAGHLTLGTYYLRRSRYRQAIAQFNKVLRQQPGHPRAIYGIAQVHELEGEHDKARMLLEPYVKKGSETTEMAFVYAKTELKARNYDRVVTIATRHATGPAATPVARQQLWFLIGQAHERSGEFDKAFEAYRSAHAALPLRFDLDRFIERIDQTIETFSAEAMGRLPRSAVTSRLPVFIVCRPRSGSTLIERILAAHPAVCAGGELDYLLELVGNLNLQLESPLTYPRCATRLNQHDVDALSCEYLKKLQILGGNAKRVTDKCLQTWEHLGLVSRLFPEAVLIDLRRKPIDNCLSCYMTSLGEAHAYSTDLRNLGLAYRQYERLMEHWRDVLDMPMLRVNYEDVVAEPEQWSRRIIEFCGLEWDDRCLRFHGGATSPTARATASYEQVRQPIYRTSVDRAANFREHLGPLTEALGKS